MRAALADVVGPNGTTRVVVVTFPLPCRRLPPAPGAALGALHEAREQVPAVFLAVGVALVLCERNMCAVLEGGVHYSRNRLLDDICPAVNLYLVRARVGAL